MRGMGASRSILLVSFPGDKEFWNITSRALKDWEAVRIKSLRRRFLSTALRALSKGMRWEAAIISSAVPPTDIPHSAIKQCSERFFVLNTDKRPSRKRPEKGQDSLLNRSDVRRLGEILAI